MGKWRYLSQPIGVALVVAALVARGQHPAPPAALAASEAPAKAYAGPWSNDPTPMPAPRPPTHPVPPQPLALARDATGHFDIFGQINGAPAEFVVDTGADVVAIPADQAQRYGIMLSPDAFRPVLRTASGAGMGAFVHLDRLDVAGVTLRDVDAVVAQGLQQTLLGQSALKKIGRVAMEGDTMTITPSAY